MKKQYIIGSLLIAAAVGGYFLWKSKQTSTKKNYTAQVWRDRQPCC